jgi:hypothetical protein
MNVEVFINDNCVLIVSVREEDANQVAQDLFKEYKIGMLQLAGVSASVVISGVRSKIGQPITDLLK